MASGSLIWCMHVQTPIVSTSRPNHHHHLALPFCLGNFLVELKHLTSMEVGGTGAARRWGERRLRSMLRHEQQTVRVALASVMHHSSGMVHTASGAQRGQEPATTARGEAAGTSARGGWAAVVPCGAPQGILRRWRFLVGLSGCQRR